MNLSNLFRLHTLLAAVYALGLVLFPQTILGWLSPYPVNAVGVDMTRLFGAALVLIAFIAWGASQLTDRAARRVIAGGL